MTKGQVVGKYSTTLGKQSLRLDIPKPKTKPRNTSRGKPVDASTAKTANTAPVLSNKLVGWVWGLPSGKGEEDMTFERAAIERTFEHTFEMAGGKGTTPSDLRQKFGDHAIPVLWTYPLPSWVGTLVSTMDLGGEAVIGGKKIIRDGTLQLSTGYRNTRVEGMWTKASAASFTLKYKLKVEQYVSMERSGRPLTKSLTWI